MADSRFFKRAGPYTLTQLAEKTGATLPDHINGDERIEDVGALDTAHGGVLSFFDNIKYKDQARQTKASACVIAPDYQDFLPTKTIPLLSVQPYKSYALAASLFYPYQKPPALVAAGAFIDESAILGDDCTIEPGAVIAKNVKIGVGCYIGANAVIGEGVILGDHCRIGANASISYSLIGHHVHIYPGCRIGQDGFGFAIDAAGHVKVPQLGRVIIEDSVEIGANTCIDRGAGPDTVIGQGTWIDNLVQIGHNVRIGKGCVIVAQVGISGSTVLEDFVVLGGQAGIAGHLHIGKAARVAAQSGVMRDIPAGTEQMGSPALPLKQQMRQIATLGRLVKKKSK